MKLKRYHKEVYFPPWEEESIIDFIRKLDNVPLIYSYHAKRKIMKYKGKYRTAIKALIKGFNIADAKNYKYIFEFCATDKKVVKKVCFRIPLENLDADVIIVISSSTKIVTIYLNGNEYIHDKLDKSIYEKGEEINVSEIESNLYAS